MNNEELIELIRQKELEIKKLSDEVQLLKTNLKNEENKKVYIYKGVNYLFFIFEYTSIGDKMAKIVIDAGHPT